MIIDQEEFEKLIFNPDMMLFSNEDFDAVGEVLRKVWSEESELVCKINDESETRLTPRQRILYDGINKIWRSSPRPDMPNAHVVYERDEVQRRLQMFLAVLREKQRYQHESIFCSRDRVEYCGNVFSMAFSMGTSDLERILHLLYRWEESEEFKSAKEHYMDSKFVLEKLKGHNNGYKSFMWLMDSSVDRIIREIRQRDKKELCSLVNEELDEEQSSLFEKAKNDWDFHFKKYRKLFPFFTKCILADQALRYTMIKLINSIELKTKKIKFQKEYSEWKGKFIENSLNDLTEADLNRMGSLLVATESYNFPINMYTLRKISCTLAPGSDEMVAVLNELDPHIGILRLIPAEYDESHQPVPMSDPGLQNTVQYGIAYVFQCRNSRNELVWLIDGVDADTLLNPLTAIGFIDEEVGPYERTKEMIDRGVIDEDFFEYNENVDPRFTDMLRRMIPIHEKPIMPDWRIIFYHGILTAARNAGTLDRKKRPKMIYFNQSVKNRYNQKFNELVQRKGSRRDVFLEKIGGTDILRKYGIRPEHYMEAFFYKTSTVWHSDCKGIVDAVEVEV